MATTELVVRFTWDGTKLGLDWLNEDNLKACLFSEEHIRPDLLQVEVESLPEISVGFIQLDIAQH